MPIEITSDEFHDQQPMEGGRDSNSDNGITDRSLDALELLSNDHEDVKVLFADFADLLSDGASVEERSALAQQICQTLKAHARLEEEVFYPAARQALNQSELLDQAEADHAVAEGLITQIQGMSAMDAQFSAAMLQLQDAVEQHVADEEGELFPRLRASDLDLQALGETMAQHKAAA